MKRRAWLWGLAVVGGCSGSRESVEPNGGRSTSELAAIVARTPLAAAFGRASRLSIADGAVRPPRSGPIDVRFPVRARGATRLALARFPDVWMEIAPDVPVDSPAKVDGALATYAAVAPATDLAWFESDGVAEELRVLRGPAAPTTFRWNVSLGPSLARIRAVHGFIEVLDHEGRARLRASPIVAFDARGVQRALRVSIDDRTIIAELDREGLVDPITVDPAWGTTASMSSPHSFGAAATLGSGKILVAGGSSSVSARKGSGVVSVAEIFDGATMSWTATAAMAEARTALSLTTLPSGKVLAFGGMPISTATPNCLSTAELYDPATGTWASTGTAAKASGAHGAVLLPSGKVIVAGGNCDTFSRSEGAVYDPTAGSWSATANVMPVTNYAARGAVLGTANRAIFLFDVNGVTDQTAIWDSSTNAFALGPTLSAPRASPSLVTLKDGKLMAMGGRWNPPPGLAVGSPVCDLLDPAGGGWTATGSMSVGRYQVPAALLSDGRVLTAGGVSTGSAPTSTAEIFDPTTRTWSNVPDLVVGRANGLMMALDSGRAVLAGGVNQSTPYNSVEVFGDASTKGTPCAAGGACASGFCVDGVCCDRACSGACESCSESTSIGTCAIVTGTSRPGHPVCSGTGTCAGKCDGVSATCTVPSTSTACVAASCTAGIEQPAAFCNGSGACGATPATKTCAPYVCGATGCKTTCSTSADCATGSYCDATGACVAKKANGGTCTANAGCTSGFCADGVCCNEACDAACKACNLSGSMGTCSAVDGVADPHKKCASGECADACKAGACAFKPASATCGAVSCTGAAMTAKGTCSGTDDTCKAPAPVPCPDGLACADTTACKTRCATATDCVSGVCDASSGKCVSGPTTTDAGIADAPKVDLGSKPTVSEFQRCTKASDCATGFCVDGVCCNSACGDRCHSCALLSSPGTCTAEPIGVDLRNECGPSAQCLGTCGPGGQCIGSGNGTMCARNRCIGPSKGVGPAYCPAPGGKCGTDDVVPFDCTPYTCEPAFGACLSGCKSSDDCANGFVCDLAGKVCVAPPPPAEDEGCSLGHARTRPGASLALLALALAGIVVRRRATRA